MKIKGWKDNTMTMGKIDGRDGNVYGSMSAYVHIAILTRM